MKIIIPLPPVTKKNNPQILYNHKTGKPFVAPSKQYQQYERDAKWFIPKLDAPINEPVNVKCLFSQPPLAELTKLICYLRSATSWSNTEYWLMITPILWCRMTAAGYTKEI